MKRQMKMKMQMKRRPLLLAALASTALPRLSTAQPLQEGKHYTRIQPPLALGPAGKVEVVEFFWYGCPACYGVESMLQTWVKQLPPWVAFRHQAAAINGLAGIHQRLWYVLDALGEEARYRSAIFAALHGPQRPLLDKPEAMIKLLQPLGLDAARFQKTWDAFDPKAFSGARIKAANRQISEQYRVSGVPTLALGGRFALSIAQGAVALRHADSLLATLKPA
jgi:protein dithiol oxidoreductase (disulfide-forming)